MARKTVVRRIQRFSAVISGIIASVARYPRVAARILAALPEEVSGAVFADAMRLRASASSERGAAEPPAEASPLEAYFDAHQSGRGIWKWRHYFDMYHRHLAKFVGREVQVAEIGIYSGGSLQMWHEYFGNGCRVHGIDIMEACMAYEDERTRIHIGDQADRAFWRTFKREVPLLDVVIDDGAHRYKHQRATMEELLPHLRPGGVYICEDIHGRWHPFASYVTGFLRQMNEHTVIAGPVYASRAKGIQRSVYSAHFYPYVVVIERTFQDVDGFAAPKHGTHWQPFYSSKPPENLTGTA